MGWGSRADANKVLKSDRLIPKREEKIGMKET